MNELISHFHDFRLENKETKQKMFFFFILE